VMRTSRPSIANTSALSFFLGVRGIGATRGAEVLGSNDYRAAAAF
jgi:hypothetical protein